MRGTKCSRRGVRLSKTCHVLLIIFFDICGPVHHVFILKGQMVNKDYYLDVLRRLCYKIRQKKTYLWKNNSFILYNDNAPSHRAKY
uniref:Putative LOC101236796 [Hydra vulgaris] n=1 Tax=Lepeophtheirus salmonis TaxID=72036 RepID=A0A0K2VHH5_LEPSM